MRATKASANVRVSEFMDTKDFIFQMKVFFAKADKDLLSVIMKRARSVRDLARQLVPKSSKKLRKAIVVRPSPGIGGKPGLWLDVAVDSPYGEAVEFGTIEYGVAPPVENLMEWVELHPNFASKYTREEAAWILADLIEEHGTPEQPYLVPAVEANRPPFLLEVKNSIEQSALKHRKTAPSRKR